MEVFWQLLETSIHSIMLYSSETWDLRKSDITKLNKIQTSVIKRFLMLPSKTPTEALYLETGLLDVEHMIYIRRINMYFRLKQNPSSLITKVTRDKEINWFTKTEKILEKFEVDRNMDNYCEKDKKLVKQKVAGKFREQLLQAKHTKSKIKYLIEGYKKAGIQDSYESEHKRMPYLNKLTRKKACEIFKFRTRMLDVKSNFKSRQPNLRCRLCDQREESQYHLMAKCGYVRNLTEKKLGTKDFFKSVSKEDLIDLAQHIETVMEFLDP